MCPLRRMMWSVLLICLNAEGNKAFVFILEHLINSTGDARETVKASGLYHRADMSI